MVLPVLLEGEGEGEGEGVANETQRCNNLNQSSRSAHSNGTVCVIMEESSFSRQARHNSEYLNVDSRLCSAFGSVLGEKQS